MDSFTFVMSTPATPLAVDVLGISVSEGAFTAIGAAVVVVLVGLSAFFSSSEIAMFSLASHGWTRSSRMGFPVRRRWPPSSRTPIAYW